MTPTGNRQDETRRDDPAGGAHDTRPPVLELTVDECLHLLSGQRLGRIAVVDEQGPLVLPVNYLLDQGSVLLRTDEGTKLDAAVRGELVAFEIDGVDEDAKTGWSVVIRGRATEVWESDELDRVRTLQLSSYARGEKEHFVRILSASISGRRVASAQDLPAAWWG